MFFYFLSIFSFSSIYAFDIGTQNVRIALGVPGKAIEILPDNQGYRASPNYLGYSLDHKDNNLSSAEWFVGPDAERIVHKNSTHGIQNPFYYLASPITKDDSFFNQIHPVTASSIAFSLYLSKFSKKQDKLIIAVPSVFSPQARHALIESLKLLNISSTQLIDSNSAVAAIYAIERLKKLTGNETTMTQKIVFIDIGAVQTEVSYWNFTRIGNLTQISLIDYSYSDEIGGEIIDEYLLKYILDQLPRQPTRAEMASIVRSMKKAKERLASGSNQFIDLYEDFQQRFEISNEVIDNISQSVNQKLNDLIQKVALNNQDNLPDDIELIGGSTRLPSFHKIIQSAFPNYTLHRSLNSDEAVALGAAYYSSLQTGTIAGSRLEFVKPAIYGLNIVVDKKEYNLYQTGDVTDRKSMKMKKFKDFNFTMTVSKGDLEQCPNLSIISTVFDKTPEDFLHVEIKDLTKLTRSITKQLANGTKPFIRFTFGHSQVFDIVDYISSSLTANVTVNVTINGEETHVDSQTSNWALSTVSNLNAPLFAYNQTELNSFINSFLDSEEERKNHAKATHKIEAFIIDLIDKIDYDSDFQEVTTQEERDFIRDFLGREREAIELSGARVHSTELAKRFDKLKDKLKDPLLRFKEFKLRPGELIKLNKTIQKAEKALVNATADNETIEDFTEFLNKTKLMLYDASMQKPLEMPTILASRLSNRNQDLQRMIPDLNRKVNRRKKTITLSTDPNSPDYNPELLKKYGIITDNDRNETKNNQTETVNATTENTTTTEEAQSDKQNLKRDKDDTSGGIFMLKDEDEKKPLTAEEKKALKEQAKKEREEMRAKARNHKPEDDL